MKCLMPVFIMLFWQNAYGADLTINLSDAEKNCLLNSNKYLSAVSEYKSAAASADSFKSSLYPKIYLEGALKYTDTITEIKTLMLSKKMGDNWNYTLGPTLYYNLI